MEARIERVPHGSAAWMATVRLRDLVLRAPLGLAFSPAALAGEAEQIHLAVLFEGELAGTVLVVPPTQGDAGCGRLRQMAVAPGRRGAGLGRRLVGAAEATLRELGAEAARLHARETAAGFYARLGYRVTGPAFVEVTLPHLPMRRSLAADTPPAV